jgi:thiamine-monophosphate kinase
MRLRTLRERELVAAIRREFRQAKRGLVLGIGDDAAVVRAGRANFLITTDLLIEDAHFTAAVQPSFWLGRKSLNVNVSDIAAMGGRPKFALLSLGLRAGLSRAWVADFFAGFKAAAEESGVALIGGDISGSKKICVSVTLVGEGKVFSRRSGAGPGDLVFVSGYLGQAAAGLRLLEKGRRLGKNRQADVLLRAFLDPVPRIELGLALTRKKYASAMIDTSDGLSVDLLHLCEESGTGAEIYLERLPLSNEIRAFEDDPESLALHGGEDYGLLFAVPPSRLAGVLKLQKRHGLHWIGKMRRGKGIFLVDRQGRKRPLEIKGYEHLAPR